MALNLSSKNTIKAVLGRYGFSPSKRLGQNFLIDKFAVKSLIKAARLTKKDTVLEIGPGLGSLTQELARLSGQVIAVEKDYKMIEVLKETSKGLENIEIIQGDILKIPHTRYKIRDTRYKVVANLPFYIVAPAIRQFLEAQNQPEEMVLLVQKEVGQRICAKPPKMNLLAVSVQFYAKAEIIGYVQKKSFWPEPKVDSAIIRISPQINAYAKTDSRGFFTLVKAGFSQPRKQLINNLVKNLNAPKEKIAEVLKKNHISPHRRPETLKISDWKNLAENFSVLFLL